MASEAISYDRAELRSIVRAFKAMDDEAATQAKKIGGELAEYAKTKIQQKAATRYVGTKAVTRIADGIKVSKSSKVGEISVGFASQRFSGGGTTQQLWAGYEFGSNRWHQFPKRTPQLGRGNAGYYIYPTLREEQPYIVAQWEESFSEVLKEWDK